jgi:uncharacterized protein YdhG (YjbR/CyaY superfamily)
LLPRGVTVFTAPQAGRPMKRPQQPKDVDSYLAAAPWRVQSKLRMVREAIREVAPDAVESISYGMPFYSYRGEAGIEGRLCYFGLMKKSVGLYLRPPVIEEHMSELAGYKATKSALHLPLERPIPVSLVKKLVRAGMKKHEAGRGSLHTRSRKQTA